MAKRMENGLTGEVATTGAQNFGNFPFFDSGFRRLPSISVGIVKLPRNLRRHFMFGKRKRKRARRQPLRSTLLTSGLQRFHIVEPLEQRLLLATDVITAHSFDDAINALPGGRVFPNEPYTLREAVIVAHQSTAETVQIELIPNTTYRLSRPTDTFFPEVRLSEGTIDDPANGDLDISRDLIINGNGATIDADDVGRIFQISGGVDVEIRNVTLIDGRAPTTGNTRNEGGALHLVNYGGSVSLIDSILQFNQAKSGTSNNDGLTARGGAIYVEGGALTLNNTDLFDNSAEAADGIGDTESNDVNNGGNGGKAEGGAIYSEEASIAIINGSKLERNQALSGDGGRGDDDGGHGRSAFGGGLFMAAGELTLRDARLVENEAIGGKGGRGTSELGGQGGWAYGGAIYVETDVVSSHTFQAATISIESTLFNINRAIGGMGGDGDGDGDGPAGGNGGRAHGGAIFAADRVEAELLDTNLIFNSAIGGEGGRGCCGDRAGSGGTAEGGAIHSAGTLTIDESELSHNRADAGTAGDYRNESEGNQGGHARGGAIYATWDHQFFREECQLTFGEELAACMLYLEQQVDLEPVTTIDDSTIAENRAKAGRGADGYNGRGDEPAAGDGGDALGGAIFVDNSLSRATLRRNEIGQNKAIGGNGGHTRDEGNGGDGGDAKGGAIYHEAPVLRIIDNHFGLNEALAGNGGGTRLGRAGAGGRGDGGALAVVGDVDTTIRGQLGLEGEPDFENLNENEVTFTAMFSGNLAAGGNGGFKLKTQYESDEDRAGNGGRAIGGAISQESGTLRVDDIIFLGNLASGGRGGHGNVYQKERCGSNQDRICVGSVGGSNGVAHGGAIYSAADLEVAGAVFTHNTVAGGVVTDNGTLVAGSGGFDRKGQGLAGGHGGAARGGAIRAEFANLSIVDSGFVANNAHAGHGGPGGPALGGSGEEVVGGRGGSGGDANGGAISFYTTSNHHVTISDSLISNQVVTAGRGGNGGRGADRVEDEEAFGGRGGDGGHGGEASGGGAAFEYFRPILGLPDINGQVNLHQTIVSRNMVAAGDGGFGGTGGTTQGETLDATIGGNGGNGGDGGTAIGGGLYFESVHANIDRSTIDSNVISSGWGGQGGHGGTSRFYGGYGGHAGDAGSSLGGGVASHQSTLQVSHATLVQNIVLSGHGGNGGFGAPSRLFGGNAGNAGDGGDARGGGIYHNGNAQQLAVDVTTIGKNVVNAAQAGFVGVRGPIVGTLDLPERYQPEAESGLVLSSTAIFTPSRGELDPTLQTVFDTGSGDGVPTDVIVNDVLVTAGLAGAASTGYALTLISSGIMSAMLAAPDFAFGQATLLGSFVGGGFSVAIPALGFAGFAALVTVGVTVSVKIGIGLAQGDSLEESVRDALGDPGPVSGPNLGLLLVGGSGNDDEDLPTQVIGPGDPGQAGADGIASGSGISGSVTVGRTIVAGNKARERRMHRDRVATTECIDPIDRETIIECDPLTVRIERDLVVFEVTQSVHGQVVSDVADGLVGSRGTNLIGIADAGFQNDLHGTSANPLKPRFASELALNGGRTPTLALRMNSPALDALSIDQADTSQNEFLWVDRAEIGAWGNPDTDFDGIVDDQETQFGTDPLDPDSDDDTLLDGEEVFGLDLMPNTGDELGISPLDADTDDDGLTDSREVLGADGVGGTGDDLPSNPTLLDTDSDGIQDGTELGETQGHPTDTRRDLFVPDADAGITTTDPRKPDSDAGGLDDGVEDVNRNGRVDPDELDPRNGDDDRPVYNFAAASFSTLELDTPHVSNVVTLTRTGGTVLASSVQVLLLRDVGQELPPEPSDIITVEFPRFATTKSVPIPINGDTVQESDERIDIIFTNTPAAEEGDVQPWTSLTIVDDDAPGSTTPPHVESVAIDQDNETGCGVHCQRSLVRRLTVTFDSIVDIATEAFRLQNTTTGQSFVIDDADVAISETENKTVAVLTFANSSSTVLNGSLEDGNYTLTINKNKVTEPGRHDAMAADFTDDFFRLFGDVDGDRDVDALDFNSFRATFFKTDSDPEFNEVFDFDGSGGIDVLDFNAFRARFFQQLTA